jgi:glycosyltransferase involved in cell wall biosynthesis
VSFHWFSQTIGPSRGLECLAQALPLLTGKWELHLRGRSDLTSGWISETFGNFLASKVFILPPTTNELLAAHTASHDVGLALEIPYAANKDLTASNKIFEYMRCGLGIIATDTKGQNEAIAACPQVGRVVTAENAEALAGAMQHYIDDRVALQAAKQAALVAAQTVWAWETFEPTVQAALQAAVGDN